MEEDPGKPPIADPSVVDDLVGRTKKFLRDLATDYIRRPVDDLLRWVLGRAIAYVIAAALFATAAVFLMIAGSEGLKQAGVPPYLAYLALGAVGVLAGLIVLRANRPPGKGGE